MRNKKGISLIVLIITIIVVIILAAVVILTLSKNNPIESAKEARFKEDVRTFQDELALTVSKQYTTAGGHRDEKITTSDFDEIQGYIPSFSEKYKDKFVIKDDELLYTKKLNEKEKEYAQNLNVKEKVLKLLPDEYQQVEYIESTGTQYIDTKIYPYRTTTVIKFEITKIIDSGGASNYLAGCYNINDNRYYIGRIYIGNGELSSANRFNNYTKLIDNSANSGIHEIIYNDDNNCVIFDGVIKGTFSDLTTQSQYSFYLFGRNSPEIGFAEASASRIYSCKLVDKTLQKNLKNFIPCKSTTTVTNADGNIVPANTKGLYDTVEGKFYTNQGTGEFIAGPDVNE